MMVSKICCRDFSIKFNLYIVKFKEFTILQFKFIYTRGIRQSPLFNFPESGFFYLNFDVLLFISRFILA